MKNLKTFEEFVNENSSNILLEAREYFKGKNNPKLVNEYNAKIKSIFDDFIQSTKNLKNIEVADKLTDIFPEAKTWWNQKNPNWDDSNPYVIANFLSSGNLKDFKYEPVQLEGWDETNPYFSSRVDFRMFVQKDKVAALTNEWRALCASVAKKHGIPCNDNYEWPYRTSRISLKKEDPSSLNFLWWDDERGGKTIDGKYPDLGYVCVNYNFNIVFVPTPEESKSFQTPPKMKAAWSIIKKTIDPNRTSSMDDDDSNLKVIGGYTLGDFVQVWDSFYASEDLRIDSDLCSDIVDAIVAEIGPGKTVNSKANFAVSGAENRQVYMGKIPYIRHDWDGTSIFVPKDELNKFESLCKGIKIALS